VTVDPAGVASALLGGGVSRAAVTSTVPVVYDPFLPGRSVDRVTGVAELPDGATVPWNAIVKRSSGAGLRPARRELAAYRHGLTGRSSALSAPALLGWDDSGGQVEVWLELLQDRFDDRWPVAQFGVAARRIGARDAAMVGVAPVARFDSEDAWAERHGQPERLEEVRARRGRSA